MFHHTLFAMNTRFSMVLPELAEKQGRDCAHDVESLLRQQERMMSRFVIHGDLASVNQTAAEAPAPVSASLWQVLEACRRHHELTSGAFDIAVGDRRAGPGMHAVRFDDTAQTVRFLKRGVELDLGAIGKGIALDGVRNYLVQRGVHQAFLSFGESSIAVIGAHPGGDCWPVGIEHLYQAGESLHCFALRDAAISTSGNRAGEAHIVDPRSGRFVEGCATMSVACASAADAEVLSTALLVLPSAQRAEVMRNYPGAQAVAFTYEQAGSGWRVHKDWHDEE